MRAVLLIMMLLLPVAAFAELPGAIDEPNEWAIWGFITTTGGWMLRSWWRNKLEMNKRRVEDTHKLRVEQRLEKEWSNGDETLSGSKNPGRTIPQLVEIVHEDLQQHKAETTRRIEHMAAESNKRFDTVHGDLGKIKGKLNIT